MNATQVFQTLSETEPFFTVSSSHRYRQKEMLREDELRFWREGRHCVADVIDFVGQNSFDSILDYGCGVGRLLRCMAAHATHAHGVDICPRLLKKAGEICPQAVLLEFDQWAKSAPMVEFSYSVIVFQHIPEAEGLKIVERLLNHTRKLCAFHIVVGERRNWITKSLFHLSFVPPFDGISNLLRARSWSEPRIPMFCWDRQRVEAVFKRAGFAVEPCPLENCVGSSWESYLFVGRRCESISR